jgi:hypothetical protein
MSQLDRPEVSNPELRAALDRVGPHIENYIENLDRISKDIKSVEQYLASSGVNQTAHMTVDRVDSFPDGERPDEMDNYSGPLHRTEESIEWSVDKGDRWRIMYVKSRQSGYLELSERIAIVGPSFNGACEELERKPLIETPAATRMKAHKNLSKLIDAVGKLVEFQPLTDDDIPF